MLDFLGVGGLKKIKKRWFKRLIIFFHYIIRIQKYSFDLFFIFCFEVLELEIFLENSEFCIYIYIWLAAPSRFQLLIQSSIFNFYSSRFRETSANFKAGSVHRYQYVPKKKDNWAGVFAILLVSDEKSSHKHTHIYILYIYSVKRRKHADFRKQFFVLFILNR